MKFKMRTYLGDFTGWGKTGEVDWNSVMGQFAPSQIIPEPTYVYAGYFRESYEGSAVVLFKQGRKWFYFTGSHCSCYGLSEHGWHPEEFKPALHFKALKEGKRIITFWGGGNEKEMDEWLAWAVNDAKMKSKRKKEKIAA